MPTKSTNVTLDTDVIIIVDDLRKTPKESRSFSNMIEVLVKEALVARKLIKPETKKHK
jgi:hypothetical protein